MVMRNKRWKRAATAVSFGALWLGALGSAQAQGSSAWPYNADWSNVWNGGEQNRARSGGGYNSGGQYGGAQYGGGQYGGGYAAPRGSYGGAPYSGGQAPAAYGDPGGWQAPSPYPEPPSFGYYPGQPRPGQGYGGYAPGYANAPQQQPAGRDYQPNYAPPAAGQYGGGMGPANRGQQGMGQQGMGQGGMNAYGGVRGGGQFDAQSGAQGGEGFHPTAEPPRFGFYPNEHPAARAANGRGGWQGQSSQPPQAKPATPNAAGWFLWPQGYEPPQDDAPSGARDMGRTGQ
ncbi:hypothetical protein [Magnetofaba australis]|uniref:hypothetical protein n=1 Tax=Magnetofaba australis TaxID=1472297 RepID=UPI000A19F43B|nr:hypothetical protein [Magnetofaba australis]